MTGGRVYYQILGTQDAVPLLVLHGGPGVPHDYLEPLGALSDERPVIFYDQLGCGRSDQPDDLSLWRIRRFVEELGLVRQALRLERVHLFGHSWGTMLATEYVLTQPPGVLSLILASPALSIARLDEDAVRLRSRLPARLQRILDQHEAAGTTESAEYQPAVMEAYLPCICRLDPWPDVLQQTTANIVHRVLRAMRGTSFYFQGQYKGYDRTGRLHEIDIPTLFTCGRYDHCTPGATADYQSLLTGSEMVVFEQSGHMPHLEETERYLQVVREFLHRAERL